VVPTARVRGEHRVLERLVNSVARLVEGCRNLQLAIMHADAHAKAAELEDIIREKLRPDELLFTDFTPVMGAHAGPGVIGLAYHYENST